MRLLFLSAIMALSFAGCITRAEIEAEFWNNNGLDAKLCGPSKAQSPHPSLWDYGIYRKLDTGKFQLIPYCSRNPDTGKPYVAEYLSANAKAVTAILDETLPKESE